MPPKRKRGGGRRPPERPPRTRAWASPPEPVETVATEEEEKVAAGDAGEGLNLDGRDSGVIKLETLWVSGGEVVGEVGEEKVGGDREGDGCCAVLASNCEVEVNRREVEEAEDRVEVTSLHVEENDREREGEDSILEWEKCEFVQQDEEDPEEILDEAGDRPEEVLDEAPNNHNMEDDGEETQGEEVLEVESVVRDDGNMQMGEDEESKGVRGGDDGQDNDELEADPAEFMHDSLSEGIKHKEFEIFVSGLCKDAVEEDLIKVFGVFGEIRATRILKNPISQRSKGYAFIRYATVEQAKRALNELKGGIEVRGKRVDISAGEDNDTLYVGNICKTWSKEYVLKKMRSYGIKHIKEIYRPEDPISEGKYKGFVLLVFSNYVDAMAAFQRLRKHDAIFGCERSARVAFAQSSMHPSEESLLHVKTVYIEGIPDSWDEEKLEVHCQQYGEVEKIQLPKSFSVGKRKDFAYVSFAFRESAVACIDSTNNAQVEAGGIKLKANLARPQNKGRLVMQGPRGGFKIRTNSTEASLSSKLDGHVKSKAVEAKERGHGSFRGDGGGQSSKPHFRACKGSGGSGLQDHQGGEQFGSGNHVSGGKKDSKRFCKKAFQERQKREYWWEGGAESEGGPATPQTSLKPSKTFHGNLLERPTHVPYTVNSTTASYNQRGYGLHPGSKRLYSETQPHSGHFGSSAKQGRGSFGYGQIVPGAYNNNASTAADYARGTAAGYAGGTAARYAGGAAPGYFGGTAPGYSEGRYAGGTAPEYAGGSVGQASYSVQYPGYHGYESRYSYPPGSHTCASGEYPSRAAYQSSSGTYPPDSNGPYWPTSDSYTSMTSAYPHAAGAYPRHSHYSYPSGSHTYASGEYPPRAANQSSSGTYPPDGGIYPTSNGPYLPTSDSYTSMTSPYPHAAGAYPPHRPYY